METKQKEYNKVYAEYQKIKKCIESCETFEQLRSASGMAWRFEDRHNKTSHVFTEVLSPLLSKLIETKIKTVMKKNTFKTEYEELMYKSNNPDIRDEDEGFQLAAVLISFVVLAVFMAVAFYILYIVS